MASIKDALDESTNERGAFYKYIIFAIPVFYTFFLYKEKSIGLLFYIMLAISVLLILGIMTRCANNVMNYRDKILPGFNIFSLFFDAIMAGIAIAPWAALNTFIAITVINKLVPMIPIPWAQQGVTYITIGLCFSITLTAFMLYAKSKKITDAYNFKIISDSCIDIMIQVVWLCIQLALINALIIGTITYLFWLFLGLENVILFFTWSMTIILNAAMIGNYLGQLNYEALHHDD